ncbi:MAG: NAD(P)/FAD-dependent oxidoreductase [Longimicrobiales bacterium]
MLNPTPEVLIIGGGPAGAAAGRLLAAWGHDVVLVERNLDRPPPEDSLTESLPPSIRKPLAATQLLAVVEAADFHPNEGNTSLWDGESRSDDFGAGATGFHVSRSKLDPLLRNSAASAGVQLVAGSARLDPRDDSDSQSELEVTTSDGVARVWSPKWTLDCTGRTGVLARAHRVLEREAPTLAVVRRYEASGGWDTVNEHHALVESFENGWAWSVPSSTKSRHIAMMVDPALQEVFVGEGNLSEAFDRVLNGTELMRSVAECAAPVNDAWACSASMYTSEHSASGRALYVGDACSFLDPLSSYGVKKALASAWLAAVTVNTALETPALGEEAVSFYGRREQEMYRALRGTLADHLVEAGADSGPFWEVRRDWLRDPTASRLGQDNMEGLQVSKLRRDPAIQDAFKAIKQGSGRLDLGEEKTVDRLMVMGNRLRMAPALVGRRFPDGVRHLRNVDLLRVVRLAPASQSPGALYESYSTWAAENDGAPVDLGDFLGTLALLVAEGILIPRS